LLDRFGKDKKQYYLEKSIVPTEEQLSKLDLQDGMNEITYTVESKIQGR